MLKMNLKLPLVFQHWGAELIVEQEVHKANVKVKSMKEKLEQCHNETSELRTKLHALGTSIQFVVLI